MLVGLLWCQIAEQICKNVFDCRRSCSGPEWIARNLAAYLDSAFLPMSEDWLADNPDALRKFSFVIPTTDVANRSSDLLSGKASQVDLTAASPCEMQELNKAAKFARTVS